MRSSSPVPQLRLPDPAAPAMVGPPGLPRLLPAAAGPGPAVSIRPDAGGGSGPVRVLLSVRVRRELPRPLLAVTGELDIVGAPLLHAVLEHVRRTTGWAVDVDLRRVCFADSHGLAPILDGGVAVRAASPAVRRVLAVLGVPVVAAQAVAAHAVPAGSSGGRGNCGQRRGGG